MDDEQLALTIGKNIMRLRKMANMTQLELAEKLNYSDKSVSKWEQGNGIPDVRILMQLSELFGVTLDDLVKEHRENKVLPKNTRRLRRFIIICSSVGLCWLIAVVAFVLIGIIAPELKWTWLAFLYAVPVSAIVVLVFSCVWKYKWLRVISLSVLIWTTLACCYLTVFALLSANAEANAVWLHNLWLLFLIGVPLQALALFFFVWWKKARFKP